MQRNLEEKDRYRCVFQAAYRIINLQTQHLNGRAHREIVIYPDGDDVDDIRERYKDPQIAAPDAENGRLTVRVYDADAVSVVPNSALIKTLP